MKRYPAYDPPEYLSWEPDPRLVDEFEERLRAHPDRRSIVERLHGEALLQLYSDLLTTRLHDIALKRWVRQGVISKAWLGTGEEAVTVGSTRALRPGEDALMPMIRNAGALHIFGMSLADMFRGYLATADSPTGGRDLHIGAPELGIYQPVSQMGTNVPVMAGVALAFRNRREKRVALTWVGDGAIHTAACHEGANFAAVQNLPLVIVLQNNQVALGTRLEEHCPGDLDRWAEAYGLPCHLCDGNNVLDVLAATTLAVGECRAGRGPSVVVANTFRMGGHATHDEKEARETFPGELFTEWGRRDPIGLYEEYLVRRGVDRDAIESTEAEVTEAIESAQREALLSKDRTPSPEDALYPGFSAGGTRISLETRPV